MVVEDEKMKKGKGKRRRNNKLKTEEGVGGKKHMEEISNEKVWGWRWQVEEERERRSKIKWGGSEEVGAWIYMVISPFTGYIPHLFRYCPCFWLIGLIIYFLFHGPILLCFSFASNMALSESLSIPRSLNEYRGSSPSRLNPRVRECIIKPGRSCLNPLPRFPALNIFPLLAFPHTHDWCFSFPNKHEEVKGKIVLWRSLGLSWHQIDGG